MKMAALLAEASASAYQGIDLFQTWANSHEGTGLEFFERAGTQAYAFEIGANRVLAFRGTEPTRIEDWQTDANLSKLVLGEGGFVHEGFAEALDLIWEPTKKWLDQAGGKQVWVTGHSLGGALALIAGARIGGVNVYTYGQPRVGDQIFAMQAEAKLGTGYCRFVHNRDIVAKVPPYTMGFRHFGREFVLQNGQVSETDSGLETLDDAIHQIVGQDVRIPPQVVLILERILRIVETSANPEVLGPSIQLLENILAPFKLFGGARLQVFADKLIEYMKSRQSGSSLAIGPIDDHDTKHYVSGLASI
jgi:hypothetical protein